MTQGEVGTAAKCARSYVSAVEDGQQNLTFTLAHALARAVGESVRTLLRPIEESDLRAIRDAIETGQAPIRKGTLAIELPESQAFQAARTVAERDRPKHGGDHAAMRNERRRRQMSR